MQIINIHSPINSQGFSNLTNITFGSSANLLDANLILWDMSKSLHEFNNSMINSWQTDTFDQLIEKRKKEFIDYFELGRSLVIFSTPVPIKTFNIVNSSNKYNLNLFDCLEIETPKYEISTGKNISSIENECVKDFLHSQGAKLHYNVKFLISDATPLMYVNETKYIVSQFVKVRKGLIIFLPEISQVTHYSEQASFLLNCINLIEELHKMTFRSSLQIQDWAKDYLLKNENIEIQKKEDINRQIEELNKSLSVQSEKLKEYNNLKMLFSGTGKDLEQIVEKIFIDFGFQMEERGVNRDDLIIRYNQKIGVIEVKGVSKSAGEKQAAQLEKWVSSYLIEKGVSVKGILIVNTYRNLPIEDRVENDFPAQMLEYSKNRNHCLISGLQLLAMYLDFKNGLIDTARITELLFDTVGVLEYTTTMSDYVERCAKK